MKVFLEFFKKLRDDFRIQIIRTAAAVQAVRLRAVRSFSSLSRIVSRFLSVFLIGRENRLNFFPGRKETVLYRIRFEEIF